MIPKFAFMALSGGTYYLNFRFTARYANTSDYPHYGKYLAKPRS